MPSKNKSRSNQATRQSHSSSVPAWVWLFTGAVLGAFIMFLMRLSDAQNDDITSVNETKVSGKNQERKETQKPRFDFYDLLKETHVPITEEPISGSSGGGLPADIQQEFLLQVASFKSHDDADRLRAELILLNLDAQTEQAKIRNGETWHRVIVGPFSSRSKLAKARSILLANRYEALVLKRQPEG